jgi:hypothetical protein
MTKLTISDSHGNEVTVDTDAALRDAERIAKRLFDHVKAAPTSPGPGAASQSIGFRWTDPRYVDLRDGDHLHVKARS